MFARPTLLRLVLLAAAASAGCGGLLRGAMVDPGADASAGASGGSTADAATGSSATGGSAVATPSVAGDVNPNVPTANNVDDTSTLSCQAGLASSAFVKCGADQKLSYVADGQTGATVLDFSGAGYRGGGKALPVMPVAQTLAPSGGDDTDAIQAALTAAGKRAADANGWRGRVVLAPGTYTVSKTLTLTTSGVALEGTASQGPQATTLVLAGSANLLLSVQGSANASVSGTSYTVQGVPVPAGTDKLTLNTASGLQVGDAVRVISPRNLAWITMVWGGTYPPVRDGNTQAAWGTSMVSNMSRTIVAISGNVVQLDAPLADTLPAASYAGSPGATVQKEAATGYVREVGLSHVRLQGRFVAGDLTADLLTGVRFNQVENAWLDDVDATDFGDSTAYLAPQTRAITVQDVRTTRTGAQDGSAKPFDFTLYGQRILVQGCVSNGNKTFYACQNSAGATGPSVIQNYRVNGAGTFEPHQRWSPGILFDNIYIPAGGIALKDRGVGGSGQGWGTGFSVAYNSLAGLTNTSSSGMDALPGHTINQPPGSFNLGIGLVGPNRSAAASSRYDSAGQPVGPASVWAHQLWQRLGDEALATVIGPWHLTVDGQGTCLAAASASAGALLASEDCTGAGQRALFDWTSRGAVRLGGTSLCLTAGASGAAATLQACSDATSQLFVAQSRAGYRSVLALKSSAGVNGTAPTTCVNLDGRQAVVGACDYGAGPFRMLVTHLAR